MGFLDNIVHDFPQINLDVPIRIRLCIKDAALGIVLVNQIEKIIELVVRELLFQLLRQIVFDVQPDGDGYIEVDLGKIVDYIIKEAHKDEMGDYDPDEILFIVQGEMEYTESLGEE